MAAFLPPLVLMLGGTSLTAGRLCNPPIPWTNYLQRDMTANPACKGRVIIINTGQGSQTSNFGASQAALFAPLRPTHVLMEDFAINDCAIGPVTIPQATANFNSMVASYRAANPDVIIVHQTMSSASAADVNRANLPAYYDNGLANAALNDLLSLDNYYGTPLVPGGWIKPLPLNLTVGSSFSITPTAGYAGQVSGAAWDPSAKGAVIDLSNLDQTATLNSNGSGQVHGNTQIAGLIHFEMTYFGTSGPALGIANSVASLATNLGFDNDSIGLFTDGHIELNGVNIGSAGFSPVSGGVYAVEVNVAAKLIYFMTASIRSAAFDFTPLGATVFPALSGNALGSVAGTGGTAKFAPVGDGLHPIWDNAFQLYSYPNILAWAIDAMQDYWPD